MNTDYFVVFVFHLAGFAVFLNVFQHRPSCRICVSWNTLVGTADIDNGEFVNNFKYGSIVYFSSKVKEECAKGKT